jgi:hypothetical protein
VRVPIFRAFTRQTPFPGRPIHFVSCDAGHLAHPLPRDQTNADNSLAGDRTRQTRSEPIPQGRDLFIRQDSVPRRPAAGLQHAGNWIYLEEFRLNGPAEHASDILKYTRSLHRFAAAQDGFGDLPDVPSSNVRNADSADERDDVLPQPPCALGI